jgi:hypothetical protein
MLPILRKADMKTKHNIWMVFVKPLIMMSLCTVGYQNSFRGKICFQELIKKLRVSLKKFLLVPKCTDKEIINFILN